MASDNRIWSFKANGEQHQALKDRKEEYDENKTEALKHYVTLGIQAEKRDQNGSRADDSSIVSILVAQLSVVAIAILMMGPGMSVIPEEAAWYVSLGLLTLAFWTFISWKVGLLTGARDRIEKHLQWVREQAERDHDRDLEPEGGA